MTEKCWLCMRVSHEKILEVARRLFTDLKVAHEVGREASNLLRQAYLKDKTALCGKSTRGLIASAIRLATRKLNLLDEIPTQRELAKLCNVSEATIRNNEYCLVKLLEIEKYLPSKSFHQWRLSSIVEINERFENIRESVLFRYVCPCCGKVKWLLRREYKNGNELIIRISEREAKELIEINEIR